MIAENKDIVSRSRFLLCRLILINQSFINIKRLAHQFFALWRHWIQSINIPDNKVPAECSVATNIKTILRYICVELLRKCNHSGLFSIMCFGCYSGEELSANESRRNKILVPIFSCEDENQKAGPNKALLCLDSSTRMNWKQNSGSYFFLWR